MRKLALYALAAAAAAGVATTPAHATIHTCSRTTPLYVDAACYSEAHGMFCDVHVQHKCVNINLPGSIG